MECLRTFFLTANVFGLYQCFCELLLKASFWGVLNPPKVHIYSKKQMIDCKICKFYEEAREGNDGVMNNNIHYFWKKLNKIDVKTSDDISSIEDLKYYRDFIVKLGGTGLNNSLHIPDINKDDVVKHKMVCNRSLHHTKYRLMRFGMNEGMRATREYESLANGNGGGGGGDGDGTANEEENRFKMQVKQDTVLKWSQIVNNWAKVPFKDFSL